MSLGPYRTAELPPRSHGFWKMVGPGAVLVGLSVGAGELIIWPTVTATFGPMMTWAAILGIFLQLWINFEIARYTLATGETIFTAYIRLSRKWAWVFLALTVFGWLLPGWARACGGALKALLVGPGGPGSPWVWTTITFAFVAITLFGPKLVYRSVERTTGVLVVLVTMGLIFIAFSVGGASDWAQLAEGATSFPYKHPDMPVYEFFSAFVFAGAGGTANLFYSFYLRDKGWGMGARVPKIVNTLRDREEGAVQEGYLPPLDEVNLERWHDWFRHTQRDQIIFFWVLNTVTILLFIFGALAVLHERGLVPDHEMLVWDEAAILGSVWGPFGRTLFLLIGVACLFSTQLTLVDGVARSIADIVHTAFPAARSRSLSWWYAVSAWTWIILGCGLTFLWEGLPAWMFLLSAGFFGGIAMAVYCPLTLLANVRLLPEPLRPSMTRRFIIGGISLFYGSFAIYSLVVMLPRLFS